MSQHKFNEKLSSNNEKIANLNSRLVAIKPTRREPPAHAFKPGNTYGKGRPVGSRNKSNLLLDGVIDSNAVDCMGKLVEIALAGDFKAMTYFLNRAWKPRTDLIQFELPPLDSMENIITASSSVIAGICEGKLTINEGAKLIGLIEKCGGFHQMSKMQAQVSEMQTQLKELRKFVKGKSV